MARNIISRGFFWQWLTEKEQQKVLALESDYDEVSFNDEDNEYEITKLRREIEEIETELEKFYVRRERFEEKLDALDEKQDALYAKARGRFEKAKAAGRAKLVKRTAKKHK